MTELKDIEWGFHFVNSGPRYLVFEFVSRALPDEYERVRSIFSRRGAFARFKDLLERKDLLEQWYKFENEATERALKQWCEQNGLVVQTNKGLD